MRSSRYCHRIEFIHTFRLSGRESAARHRHHQQDLFVAISVPPRRVFTTTGEPPPRACSSHYDRRAQYGPIVALSRDSDTPPARLAVVQTSISSSETSSSAPPARPPKLPQTPPRMKPPKPPSLVRSPLLHVPSIGLQLTGRNFCYSSPHKGPRKRNRRPASILPHVQPAL